MGWFSRGKDELKGKLDSLDNNVRTSFENIKRDMTNLGQWLGDFSKKNSDQDKGLESLEKKIKVLWDKIDHLEHEIERSSERSNSLNSQKVDIEPVKPVYDEVFTRVQSFNRSVQPFMNVQNRDNLDILTPAQKRVVGLLAFAGGPLGYGEISKNLGINEVTARRHINDIKRAGIGVMRKVSVNSRRSMFYLDDELRKRLENMKSESSVKERPREEAEEEF